MTADSTLTPTGTHPWVAACRETIKFGISIYPQPPDWQHFIRLVQKMEADGLDSYWSYDHPIANADCWTALSALAVSTSTIRLGTLVDCIYYRSPFLLARQAADVDRASGGRLILGLGIGDNVPEFDQMGIPFPSTRDRQAALEETIAIVRGLWSGKRFSFEGAHFRARTNGDFLPPVQQPWVPILLGGGGERVTLRQVAQYADANNMGAHDWIGSAVTTEDIGRKFGKLREYCDGFGRSYDSVLRSHFTMPLILAETQAALEAKMRGMNQQTLEWCGDALFAGTPDEAITFYRELHALGFQYFIANVLGGDDETCALIGEALVPAFA